MVVRALEDGAQLAHDVLLAGDEERPGHHLEQVGRAVAERWWHGHLVGARQRAHVAQDSAHGSRAGLVADEVVHLVDRLVGDEPAVEDVAGGGGVAEPDEIGDGPHVDGTAAGVDATGLEGHRERRARSGGPGELVHDAGLVEGGRPVGRGGAVARGGAVGGEGVEPQVGRAVDRRAERVGEAHGVAVHERGGDGEVDRRQAGPLAGRAGSEGCGPVGAHVGDGLSGLAEEVAVAVEQRRG